MWINIIDMSEKQPDYLRDPDSWYIKKNWKWFIREFLPSILIKIKCRFNGRLGMKTQEIIGNTTVKIAGDLTIDTQDTLFNDSLFIVQGKLIIKNAEFRQCMINDNFVDGKFKSND